MICYNKFFFWVIMVLDVYIFFGWIIYWFFWIYEILLVLFKVKKVLEDYYVFIEFFINVRK